METSARTSRLSSHKTAAPVRANTVKRSSVPMTAAIPRILLTDAAVKREAFAQDKPRIVRDSKVAGLHLWIGKRKKTFRYQFETRRVNGERGTTRIEWLGEHPHHS